jgi:hypothetical protein
MDLGILIPLFGIFFVIGVPVMAIASHFVLRPLIRDLTGALRGVKGREKEDIEHRLSRLEDALLDQGRQLDRLVEAELFRRRLESGEIARSDSAGLTRSAGQPAAQPPDPTTTGE